MYHKNKNAFTLIEMLIVVVIIGILAAALIPRLQGAQARTRDMSRVVDIKTAAEALAIHYQDFQYYPKFLNTSAGWDKSTDTFNSGGILSQLVPSYLSRPLKDPINNAQYHYTYNGNYEGIFCTTSDPNCNTIKNACGFSWEKRSFAQVLYYSEQKLASDIIVSCPNGTPRTLAYAQLANYNPLPGLKDRSRGAWVYGDRAILPGK